MIKLNPILTIKQKCRECDGIKITIDKSVEKDMQMKAGVYVCKFCKGTGQQEMKITPLRDFKCRTCDGQGGWYIGNEETGEGDGESCQDCKGTGYKIPKEYEPYEIKKVSEIECKYGVPKGCCYKDCWQCDLIHEYNLKEDDKIIVRVK